MGRVIGEGAFCQVRLGIHHLSREKVAVKVFDKTKFKSSQDERMVRRLSHGNLIGSSNLMLVPLWLQMRREVRVMRHLTGHDRIVCLYETLEKDRWLYLVMEHCAGGSLFEYVSSRKTLSEPEAARLSVQLIQGLSYCHSRGVVHRDIKLENVMVDERNNIKIIDLGLSAFFSHNERLARLGGLDHERHLKDLL